MLQFFTAPTLHQALTVRKYLQKFEFMACWVIFFFCASAITSVPVPVLANISSKQGLSIICPWMKVSVFTRALSYVIDFSNAWDKFHGVIPTWLVLHHLGVLVQNMTEVFFLIDTPNIHQLQINIMICALASQTTHNTWTKKYSLLVYWGNVLIGVLACSYCHSTHDSDVSPLATKCYYYSLIMTSIGIMLLVLENIFSKQMHHRFKVSIHYEKKKAYN